MTVSAITEDADAIRIRRELQRLAGGRGWLNGSRLVQRLAGNLTITGSVANIIVVEKARAEAHISFWEYMKIGVPVTVITLAIGLMWLAVVK